MCRKINFYETTRQEGTITTNSFAINSKENRPENEVKNAAYNTSDSQPQGMGTIKDGPSVQQVTSEVKEYPYSCDPNTKET